MGQFRIFIVEDDQWYGQLLKYHLSLNPDYEVHLFENGQTCLSNLHLQPDVISIDFDLPDMTGERLLERIKQHNNLMPVLVISGQKEIAVALDLLKKGAYEYLIKDENTKELLWNSILRIRENSHLRQEVAELKEMLESRHDFEKSMIGQSPAIKKAFTLIEKAIHNNINVSVTGETGTGKEVVARAIHYNSPRKKKNFVAVNMAAIPPDLAESELFGYEKGAFTGATTRKIGKFEEAHGGTLFLDEIAEMDLNLQSKILRAIQEREITRLGGNQVVPIDIRIITATHKNLADEVQKGLFREDLFYRIIGLPIHLPALRERGNDILLLSRHFMDIFTKENKMRRIDLSAGAREKLLQYTYPGNVRELKSIIDLACVMSDGTEITAEDIMFSSLKPDEHYLAIEKTLKQYTIDIIRHFMKKYDNNVLLVAEKLDIGKSTIYNLINAGDLKKN